MKWKQFKAVIETLTERLEDNADVSFEPISYGLCQKFGILIKVNKSESNIKKIELTLNDLVSDIKLCREEKIVFVLK